MPSPQLIKSRIKSVKNTRQITKAMELVAASKMRRAQDLTQRSRLFAHTARDLLSRLARQVQLNEHELYHQRPVQSRLLIVLASDRGLAGAYDSNVLRQYIAELKTAKTAGVKTYTITVGRKASQVAARLADTEVVGAYHNFPDEPDANDLRPILATAVKLFSEKTVDAVDIIYTHFYSSVTQTATTLQLLPAGVGQAAAQDSAVQPGAPGQGQAYQSTLPSTHPQPFLPAVFEPSAAVVLRAATLRLIEAQLAQAFLESAASEHSARMLAMKNASDNATDLASDLTLALNNARQASITQELAEITGGVEAMA